MTARILDGKKIAEALRRDIEREARRFSDQHQLAPQLAAVLVGDDPASQVYVRNKGLACEKAGIASAIHSLPASTSQAELLGLIDRLNRDPAVHGILVQFPLPKHLSEMAVTDAIDPRKDVDCFGAENVGLLAEGRPRFLPCTPAGIQRILTVERIPIAGARVAIIGRGSLVGRPLAMMLAAKGEGGDATVTICHSRTRDIGAHTRQADIVVAAAGKMAMLGPEMIRPGAVIIDVGIHRTADGRLVGDVDPRAAEVAGAITPVPGGVGPMTVTILLENTLRAARLAVASS